MAAPIKQRSGVAAVLEVDVGLESGREVCSGVESAIVLFINEVQRNRVGTKRLVLQANAAAN